MEPTRMTAYSISNEGMGPYATFNCDRCGREYRSTPTVAATVTESVKRGMLGGFLRNIPIVGDVTANQVENDRYRTNMTQPELAGAWGQVSQYFRECPTCHQIVCIPDFDEPTGFCDEDSPRAAEVEAAKAQQAAVAMKSVADVFGIGNAIQRSMASAAAASSAAAPGVPGAAPAAMACANCQMPLATGARFCASCGTPVAQPSVCAKCGTTLAAGARFCANCGTPAA